MALAYLVKNGFGILNNAIVCGADDSAIPDLTKASPPWTETCQLEEVTASTKLGYRRYTKPISRPSERIPTFISIHAQDFEPRLRRLRHLPA